MAIQQGVGPMAEDQIVEVRIRDISDKPKYGLRGNTPLCTNILKEAEITEVDFVINGKKVKKTGTCLGPMGSWMSADVILNALAADEDSYLRNRDSWKPTLIGAGPDAWVDS